MLREILGYFAIIVALIWLFEVIGVYISG